ncbi:histidine kinase [Halobacteriales archaeon QS_6_71_20]|nr:MAG: histidine kinase [Halobacteriales archaeon QS_6_71_20]
MADPVAEPSRFVFLLTDDAPREATELTGALVEAVDGGVTEAGEPAALAAAFDRGERPDAVVLVGDPTLPGSLRERLSAGAVPVVAYADREPDDDLVDGYVERGSVAGRLAVEIDRAHDGTTRRQLRAARERVTRLHEAAARIAAAESVAELSERAVAVADRVLSFDHCAVGVREGSEFVALERSTDWLPRRVPIEGTLVGRAHERDETVHVTDLDPEEFDNSEATGSSITVPFGDDAVLQAVSRRSHAFDDTDRELAELLAMHVGQSYERLRAQADLTRRERVMAELHEAAPRLVDAEDDDELFERTVEISDRVLSFDRTAVYVADGDGFHLRATTDPELPDSLTRGFGAMERSHADGRSIVVDDVADSDEAESHDGESRSLISVPFAGDAVFRAVVDEPNAFDERDPEFADLLVSYATVTRQRILSETALREARRVTERLHVAAADLAAADTEGELIERSIRAAEDVLSFDNSTLSLRRGDMLVPVVDSEGTEPEGTRPMDLDEGITGRTYRTGESTLVADLTEERDAEPVRSEYRSAISVPVGDLGVFQAVATERAAFDHDDLRNAELLMAHVAVSLERLRTQGDLRAQRDRLSALFENVPDAAVSFELVDGVPVVRAVNSAFEETFGFDEEIVGESIDEYIVPPDERSMAAEFNDRLAAGESLRRECRRETVDGVRDFLMYVVPLEVGEENVGGYAIYSDITERRERERALRRQNERLDEFASVVSHDLRNPLSVADGYLDLARETGDLDHLDTVADAVDRMREMIDDLLRLARDGRVVGETERVDLADAAREAWAIVETDDATLDAVEGATLDADPDRLRELLENLFRNAVEHSGESTAVRVGATPDGFAVSDDGPGIPEADREEVFDVGVSTAENGTGFGLAIVRRIAEAHGWSVTLAESAEGGARFEFETSEA